MYSDEEDLDVVVYGGQRNEDLLEDWVKSSASRRYVSQGYRAGENPEKPWVNPSADPSEYFNFGHTLKSWNEFLLQFVRHKQNVIKQKEEQEQQQKLQQASHYHRTSETSGLHSNQR